MKQYIEHATLEYPLNIYQVRDKLREKRIIVSNNPKDSVLKRVGFYLVEETEKPNPQQGKRLVEGKPFFNEPAGIYLQTWIFEDVPEVPPQEPVVPSKEQIIESKIKKLDNLLEQARSIGYPIKFSEDSEEFEHVQLRTNDRMQLLLLKDFIAKQEPDYINFLRTKENINHQLNRDEILSAIEQAIAYDLKLYAFYRYNKDNLVGSDDPANFFIPDAITPEMIAAI